MIQLKHSLPLVVPHNSLATLEQSDDPRVVIVGCSALLKEINTLVKLNHWTHVGVEVLSAELHNTPEKITHLVCEKVDDAIGQGKHVFVAYGDCGTGGALDAELSARGVERLPGAHCYEFFAGSDVFNEMHEAVLGTFYLTDFLAKHFDRLVIRGLGLDKRPALASIYFGHYKRVVYLAQSEDESLQLAAQQAAKQLGLDYEYYFTGAGQLSDSIVKFVDAVAA